MLIQLLWCILLTSFKCTCFNILTTDELENHISPEDLREFLKYGDGVSTSTNSPEYVGYADIEDTTSKLPVPNTVDCFGLGNFINKLGFLNMKPGSSDSINTHFYFSSRQNPLRVQRVRVWFMMYPAEGGHVARQDLYSLDGHRAEVGLRTVEVRRARLDNPGIVSGVSCPVVYPGDQFGLEWVDFDPSRRTAMIVHGFMSHSNASWVLDMTNALLNWADLNVIAVDWSKGGDTWKYWRAVANTRRVGSDVTGFMRQLIAVTGARLKDFHFIGHSLGAHIVSYVSFHLGRVARITGLDPAQPCYGDSSAVERLDPSDADFVDVIHTNGRLLQKIGFGLPDPIGHADFYPNGGMQQPGCVNRTRSLWSKLIPFSASRIQQAICSHGRAYMLFTESLINDNCTFRAYRWNLTYEGVNSSLVAACDRQASCAEMGINAIGGVSGPKAKGPYFVLTTEREPYCPTEWQRQHPRTDLLRDLKFGFRIDRSVKPNVTQAYGDPFEPTTQRSWFRRLVSFG